MSTRPHLRKLLLTLSVLLAIVAVGASWKAVRLGIGAREALTESRLLRTAITEARESPSDLQVLLSVEQHLVATASALRGLQTELGPLGGGLRWFRRLPEPVHWIASVPDVIAWGAPLAEAGALLGRSLGPVRFQSGSLDLARLTQSIAADIPLVLAKLTEAEGAATLLDERGLTGPLAPMAPLLAQFRAELPTVRKGIRLAAAVGPALGFEGARTYLILGENPHEIRATGGFIGTAGVLTIDHATVTNLEFGSSYLVDSGAPAPAPPRPLARYLGLGAWYLRDANWWPDFPSSAAQVVQAWERAGRSAPDGVVALDMTVVTELIDALGGLEIPTYGHVDGQRFEQAAADQLYMDSALAAAGGYHEAKAVFLAPVARALVGRLVSVPPRQLLSLASVLGRLADQKHIQMVARDAALAAALADNRWDGAIRPSAENSLLVVDTTVSYGDSFFFITPRTRLEVTIGENGIFSHELELTYQNRYPSGMPAWMHPLMLEGSVYDPASRRLVGEPGFWGDWLRVYLPPDVRNVTVEGLLDVPPGYFEADRWVQAGYLPMSPGQQRTVRLRYQRLAPPFGDHQILLQKQAGTTCRDTNIIVNWQNGSTRRYDGCPQEDTLVALRRV